MSMVITMAMKRRMWMSNYLSSLMCSMWYRSTNSWFTHSHSLELEVEVIAQEQR